jgi:hypothetical protein
VAQPEPLSVVRQELDGGAPLAAEDEDRAAEGIRTERLAAHAGEPVDAAPEVDRRSISLHPSFAVRCELFQEVLAPGNGGTRSQSTCPTKPGDVPLALLVQSMQVSFPRTMPSISAPVRMSCSFAGTNTPVSVKIRAPGMELACRSATPAATMTPS